jgi:hypothetical protein
MQARVSKLMEDSPCDNVLLEYELALALVQIKGVAVFPLFVGDKVKNDDEGLEAKIKELKNKLTSTTFEHDSDRQGAIVIIIIFLLFLLSYAY